MVADEVDEEVAEDAAAAAAAVRNAETKTTSSIRCVRMIRVLRQLIPRTRRFQPPRKTRPRSARLGCQKNDGSPFVFLRCRR